MAYMDTSTDGDYYKFSAAAGKTVAVSLTQLPADYDLYLADSGRNLVAMSRYGGAASEYIFFTAPAAGTYYVWVVGYNKAYDPVSPYRLMVQLF